MFAPKVSGAHNLASAPLVMVQPVSALKLFSSMAAALGSGGQANYAAANAVLDATGSLLQAKGMSAASVQWGPWAGAGMAANAGAL